MRKLARRAGKKRRRPAKEEMNSHPGRAIAWGSDQYGSCKLYMSLAVERSIRRDYPYQVSGLWAEG